ncbi:hypothetical protein ACE6ED_23495 [Paenibacillus sp. CN-4]|uniref:hypothetical protein n=1 Tax=Paenibacillus nanchangensis TaxID=3348343 RepID=UPI00397DC1E6
MNKATVQKKSVLIALLVILLFQLSSGLSSSAGSGAKSTTSFVSPKTPEQVHDFINSDMKKYYGKSDYFPASTEYGPLRKDLLQKALNSNDKIRNFEMVYGSDHGKPLPYSKPPMMLPFSGFTLNGDPVSAEGVPWYAGWSGIQIQNMNMIRYPWKNSKTGIKEKGTFDLFTDTTGNPYLANANGTFEALIIQGLNERYAGRKYSEFIYHNFNEEYKNRVVYEPGSSPKSGNRWIDYVHVIQPPTFLSWGSGRIYIDHGKDGVTYLGIPIAPFITQVDDLSAYFRQMPSGGVEGESVEVTVNLISTFKEEKETDFVWEIRDSNGKTIAANISGAGKTTYGNLKLKPNENTLMQARFVMPDGDVHLRFKLNTKNNPQESNYDNNTLNLTIKPVKPMPGIVGRYDLDYNILSRDFKHDIAGGAANTATLLEPASNFKWDGNATGKLNVTNTSDFLNKFKVERNDPINAPGLSFTRTPYITATIKREDFGDDPLNNRWLDIASAASPRTKSGSVPYSGQVKRDYIIFQRECDNSTPQNCKTREIPGTATAPFSSGQDTIQSKVFIYNGKEKVIPDAEFKNEINKNEVDSPVKELFWQNEEYPFDVIRWMARQDTNNKLYDWTQVNGQYERTFTQQASGNLLWKKPLDMTQAYRQGREAAKKTTNNKSKYNRAVFATDRQLQNYDYPIKSGYYFNPTGEYTFTLKTVMYKPTDADTQDHKDLVNAVIDSFRYESNLVYINSKRESVDLQNNPLPRIGNMIIPKPAELSRKEPTGVDGKKLLTVLDREADDSRYTKKVVELYHSPDQEKLDTTHKFWKLGMEGYSESNSKSSFDKYKYREFVKPEQHMYQITETTTVTIQVNPENQPVYTDARMADGAYYVKAWIKDVELPESKHAFSKAGKLVGIKPLDEIKITVRGSMYDDLNN